MGLQEWFVMINASIRALNHEVFIASDRFRFKEVRSFARGAISRWSSQARESFFFIHVLSTLTSQLKREPTRSMLTMWPFMIRKMVCASGVQCHSLYLSLSLSLSLSPPPLYMLVNNYHTRHGRVPVSNYTHDNEYEHGFYS